MSHKYIYGARFRKHHRWALPATALGLITILGVGSFINYATKHTDPVSLVAIVPKAAVVKPVAVNYGLPMKLEIAKLGVSAPVKYMGITKTGAMSVPGNVVDTGWYKYGTLPGSNGTAVIAGHLDGLKGEAGVFSKLSKLVPGDTITVTDTNNKPVSFVVRAMKSYGQDDQPTEVFTSTSGAHLNLITCAGSWDNTNHAFAKRLVVFTDKT